VPIVVLHGPGGEALALARVKIGGRSLLFIVDTGASESLIDKRVARRLRLHRVGRRHRFRGVSCGGSAQPVRVTTWTLGEVALPPRRIDSADFSLGRGTAVVGLLGADVLSSFGKISIDFAHEVLTLGG
jgi:predicted aspartyl protease